MKLTFRAVTWVVLSAGVPITSTSLNAESHCPGNIAGISPRIVAGALLVIPVKINQSGPFDFMVDTGSQLNVVDPSLAARLTLKSQGTVGLLATATYSQASVAVLDSLEAGSHVVMKPLVAIQDLQQIQVADPRIRGVLGENFLAHFDVLIDYPHRLLCLDEAKLMQRKLHGERIPLVPRKHWENKVPFSERLVISVNLSDTGNRQILLQLDSGSDGPILYSGNRELQAAEVSEAHHAFALLPPQDMRIGDRIIRKATFVTPISPARDVLDREEDGLLATVLFQRVYISHADHYVIFDPR
jgi:Aspartyl protease